MKVLHHERKRTDGHFSIERLFEEIRRSMSQEIDVKRVECPFPSKGFVPRMRNVIHASKQKADIHHIVGDSHYLAFGLPGCRTVLTIHDCAPLERLKGWRRAILKYFWFTGPMKRAAVVTTISEASKEALKKWVGVLADKVVVVPDCVFEDFVYDPKPFNVFAPVALQVGAKWNKNLGRVVEALEGIGCQLEVAGGKVGDSEAKEWVKDLGRLNDSELVEAYRRCDFVIFASLYEGFGLPILEAQASGRPVITSNIPPMTEVAGEGALFVDPNSVESIREGIVEILRNSELRNRLVKSGFENVKRFRPVEVASRYTTIYRELLKNNC